MNDEFDWEEEFDWEAGFSTEVVPGCVFAEEMPIASFKDVLNELVLLGSESVMPFLIDYKYLNGEKDYIGLKELFEEYEAFCEEIDITSLSIFAFTKCLQKADVKVEIRDIKCIVYLKQVK